jgi:hypothetical protein
MGKSPRIWSMVIWRMSLGFSEVASLFFTPQAAEVSTRSVIIPIGNNLIFIRSVFILVVDFELKEKAKDRCSQ